MENIISVNGLCIGYRSGRKKRTLLPPVSASAKKGELIAVIGRNGSGKSTLLRTIMGIQASLGGNVMIGDRDINDYSKNELARKAGYVSTERIDASNMNVLDLVALGRFPHSDWSGRNDPDGDHAIESALEKTGMTGFSSRYVSELSDGERQRAMIARALAQETDILILDEPTAFLDISGRYEIIHLMARLAREGRTILFSTHDFNIAISQADKIWFINRNAFTEGAPEDLMLSGAFNELFDPSIMNFNASDGTFALKIEKKGRIAVAGDGTVKEWTIRAMTRAGYEACEGTTLPYIKTPGRENEKWIYVSEQVTAGFDSIYALVEWMLKGNCPI